MNFLCYAVVIVVALTGTLHAQWRQVTSIPMSAVEAIDSVQGLYLLATGNGIFRSQNGLTWVSASVGLPNKRFVAFAELNNHMYTADAAGNVFRSPDAGTVWVPQGKIPGSSPLVELLVFQGSVVAVTSSNLYRLSNKTWVNLAEPSPNEIRSATVIGSTIHICTSNKGVWFLDDNLVWLNNNKGLFDLQTVDIVELNETLYVLTHGSGVFSFEPGLNQWQQLGTQGIEDGTATTLLVNNNILVCGLFDGTVFSYDGRSRSWAPVHSEIAESAYPTILFTIHSQVFCGTRLHGLWRTNLNEVIVNVDAESDSDTVRSKVLLSGESLHLHATTRTSIGVFTLSGKRISGHILQAGEQWTYTSEISALVVVTDSK